ncbi:MAG: tripartite tricarboxylate transporter permease [Bacteroidota bacterium]
MNTLQLLLNGFVTALQPMNLIFALVGSLVGTLIGVLPGIGPSAATAILIPLTFALDPTGAIIMLAAIYYGAMYGGTITSILINVPGEAASAITCLDGYQMSKNGRAGAALTIAAVGSFVGGCVSVAALVLVALPLSSLALKFGPPEFFALMLIGMTMVTGLAGRSINRALLSAVFGLLVAMIGMDPVQGGPRFTFGNVNLLSGVNIVPVIMGLFGIGEILTNLESPNKQVFNSKIGPLMPTREEWRRSIGPIGRGTGIGLFLGLIPGIGTMIPTFISYFVEKKVSKTPEKFGSGMIEGIAGPETANNSYANGAIIPLFTLGIPASPTLAILMGGLMMNGLLPGPLLFTEHSNFVWAVIASFVIGNLILLILNLPLIPMWVSVLKLPYSVLFTFILGFAVMGAYTVDNNIFGVIVMLAFSLIGYVFRKLDIPVAPFALTLILGPMMEKALRQSLEMSNGSFQIFFSRPLTAVLIVVAFIIIVINSTKFLTLVKADSEI